MRQYRTVLQFREGGQVFYGQWTQQLIAEMERDHYLGPQYIIDLSFDWPDRIVKTFYNPYKCYIEERETNNDDQA